MRLDRAVRQLARVNVAVAVADDSRDLICEVARACRAVGFEHTGTLGDVGVLTGTALLEVLPELRGVPGVIAVEVQRPFRTQSVTGAACGRRDQRGAEAFPGCKRNRYSSGSPVPSPSDSIRRE